MIIIQVTNKVFIFFSLEEILLDTNFFKYLRPLKE